MVKDQHTQKIEKNMIIYVYINGHQSRWEIGFACHHDKSIVNVKKRNKIHNHA
jgi:hypothetical protein